MSISLNLAWVIIISRSSSSLGDHVTRGPCPAKELGWAQLFRPPIGLTNRLWVSPMLPEAGDFINIFFSYMSYIYGRICLKDKKWSEKKLFVNFKTILRRFLGTCSWDFYFLFFIFFIPWKYFLNVLQTQPSNTADSNEGVGLRLHNPMFKYLHPFQHLSIFVCRQTWVWRPFPTSSRAPSLPRGCSRPWSSSPTTFSPSLPLRPSKARRFLKAMAVLAP